MSGESILDKYLSPEPRPDSADVKPSRRAAAETGVAEGYAAMLDLVFKDGRRTALPYATLMKVEFEPSRGITLRFSTDDVTIEGYRLDSLYRAIVQHRGREVIEQDGKRAAMEQSGGGPVVTGIRCVPASESGQE